MVREDVQVQEIYKRLTGDILEINLTQEDENILHSKHIGRSVIVLAFICLYHGILQLSEEYFQTNPHIKYKESFVIRSVQEDEYWK
ncbi:2992_t:CDS:2 [Dentiscutata erythropus]|uniref:2992_t:CDS:1 n=1 Tax=Dentiscutata erythropus TaxID=1348616 RepID=A0A9N9A1I0_9GLOM|nr:2992_t:CDS:2 [Dentiscutata erythropus]